MKTIRHCLPRFLFRFSSLLVVGLWASVRVLSADEFTGVLHDDPKDLIPPSLAVNTVSSNSLFQPLPYWARSASLPGLPDALKPMGKKVVVLTTLPVAAKPSLAPPKDGAVAQVAKPIVVVPTPNPAPAPTPALVAVSPFLEWIKANPQAAAEQARQQASAYQAPADASETASAPGNPAGPVSPASSIPALGGPVAPYWLPPLIDASPIGTPGSSAAIYSTPQR